MNGSIKLSLIVGGIAMLLLGIGIYTAQQRKIGAENALKKVDKVNEKIEKLATDGRSALSECDDRNWLYDFRTGKCLQPD